MNKKKKTLFKVISISLLHKLKIFKFTKYRGFLTKKNLSCILTKINSVSKILELDLYVLNVFIKSNNLHKMSSYKVYDSLIFQNSHKNQATVLINFYKTKHKFINNKCFFKKKFLSIIYRFLNQKLIKSSDKNKFEIKLTHDVNFLTENPTFTKNLKFVKEKIKNNRKNFRNYEILSIDTFGSLNFEDCIHFKFIEEYSKYEIGVHISDVASFLPIENEHIIKSIEKIYSCFLNNKKVDLFSILSSYNLYSFRPWLDRFSFSLIFNLDHSSNILSLYICKGIIRNKRSFSKLQFNKTIDQVNKKINKNNKNCLFGKNLRKILEIKKKLHSNRNKMSGKLQSRLGGNLKKIDSFVNNQKNDIIEELMLLFNISLTEKILEYFPSFSNIQRFSKSSKNIKSVFFNVILFPNIKINFKNFKFLYKYTKILVWKEKKLINNIFLIDTNFFSSISILDIFNFKNKKFIKKYGLASNFFYIYNLLLLLEEYLIHFLIFSFIIFLKFVLVNNLKN